MKREVRQRCGFGCVICGCPIYQYDHLEEWSKVKKHEAANLTLLCDKHHAEKTKGLLTKEKVADANATPFNLSKGKSSANLLHFSGKKCEINIGGNLFYSSWSGDTGQMFPLVIDRVPIIGFVFEEGNLYLTCCIFDESNNLALHIVKNELVYSTTSWDIEFVGKTLKLREKARKILLSITFNPPDKVHIKKARILCNGVEILIEPDQMLVVNNEMLFERNQWGNQSIGLIIGDSSGLKGIGMALPAVNRYLGDSSKAKAWAKSVGNEFK